MGTAKEYVQGLDPKNSYWEMCSGIVSRLNDTPIHTNNVYMVFYCTSCDGDDGKDYHVIPYTDLKIDKERDYLACCPNENENEVDDLYCENYLSGDCVPWELRELFKSTKFAPYKESDEDEGKDHDEKNKNEAKSPAERIIKSGAGGVFRA